MWSPKKSVNKTKQKQSHRYREQADARERGEGGAGMKNRSAHGTTRMRVASPPGPVETAVTGGFLYPAAPALNGNR